MDYSGYQQQYEQNCQNWKAQPVRQRKLNDFICLLIFFILTASLVGIGSFYISQKNQNTFSIHRKQIYQPQILFFIPPAVTSIIISFIYILLVKSFPKIMVYTMICLSLLVLTIICLLSIFYGGIIIAICVGIILLVYICILGCFKQQIKTGIIIIKVASIFMSQMPIVYLAPILKLILTLLLTFYWVYITNIIIIYINSTMDQVLLGLWIFIYLFYTFLFYYIMVFCVAVCCALWYYQIRGQNPLITAYKWLIKSAFGSLTFAALLISIVTFLRIIANIKSRNNRNAGTACICIIIYCSLRSIEPLLEILNHNSVIVMSVTGESYWQSAKSTIGIVFSNFPLLYICNLITNFLVFWGLIISCGIPLLGTYILLEKQYLVPCLFTTIITSIIIFSVLIESISSIFIFYCFDCKFEELGFEVQNMPLQINDLLHSSSNPYSQTEDNSYR